VSLARRTHAKYRTGFGVALAKKQKIHGLVSRQDHHIGLHKPIRKPSRGLIKLATASTQSDFFGFEHLHFLINKNETLACFLGPKGNHRNIPRQKNRTTNHSTTNGGALTNNITRYHTNYNDASLFSTPHAANPVGETAVSLIGLPRGLKSNA
jgi:hypothetical protein